MDATDLATATLPRLGAALLLGWVGRLPGIGRRSPPTRSPASAPTSPRSAGSAAAAPTAPSRNGPAASSSRLPAIPSANITATPMPATSRAWSSTPAAWTEHRDRLSVGHQRMLETYSSFRDAGLSDPAQRLGPAADLRRHPARRRHRQAGGRRQRRGRRGHRHPLPDPEERAGGDLEPPAALSRRDGGLRHRPGRGDPRRRLHAGQAEPGDRAALLAPRHDAGTGSATR